MQSQEPLFYLRWGGAALIAVLCVSTLVQTAEVSAWPSMAATVLVYLISGALFLLNLRPYPGKRPWQSWFLMAQILLSTPLESNLSVVAAATIPIVIPKESRVRWLGCIMFLAALLICARVWWLVHYNPHKVVIPPLPQIAVTIVAGTGELYAWFLFAYLAAQLIVRFDEDRRRLALLYAEMKGTQLLLADSERFDERLRIARELHDSMGHHLTSLSLQLQIAERLPDSELRPKLAQARLMARLLLADVRESVSAWKAETSAALPGALRSLDGAFEGVQIRYALEESLPAASPAITHALFRAAQEALTNAVRHGGAREFAVSLQHREGRLYLDLEDSGAGCAQLQPGNGLGGMTARIQELAGTIAFETAPGKGFRVHIEVPLAEAAL